METVLKTGAVKSVVHVTVFDETTGVPAKSVTVLD
jgi:hypothetical protein